MAFKQSSNPLSRNTSPMRRSPFRQQTMSMDELNKASAASQEQSRINSQSGTAGAPGDPGTEINYDDPRKFAGDDEGMLKSTFEPQFPGDDGYEDQGMSRKASPLNDRTSRKIKKANKTAGQIVEMQNKRSSYKKTYLGDPDDLEGEMVRTADKPASKREVRKIKKFKKTKNQLGEKIAGPLNRHKAGHKSFSDAVEDKSLLKEKDATAESASKSVSDFKSKVDKQAADKKADSKKTTTDTKTKRQKITDVKIADAKKDASRNSKEEGGTIESQRIARAKVKRLGKRADRQAGRAERKAARKDKTLSRGDRRKKIIDSREKQKKKSSPLNMHEGKKHAESSYQPIKDKDGKVILTSEQARNIDEDFPKEKKDLKPSAADIKTAKIANDKMKALKAKAKAAKAAKATKKITKS